MARRLALASILAASAAALPALAAEPFFDQPLAFDLAAPFPGPDGSPATPARARAKR